MPGPSLRISAEYPVTRSNELARSERDEFDTDHWRLVESHDSTLKVTRPVARDVDDHEEATEIVADWLFRAKTEPEEIVYELAPDEEELPDDVNLTTYAADVEMSVHFAIEAVWLAAARVARQRTRENMTRRGHSVEERLYWWAKGDNEIDCRQAESFTIVDLADHADYALRSTFDHTPGVDTIDYDAVPELGGHEPDYDEMRGA